MKLMVSESDQSIENLDDMIPNPNSTFTKRDELLRTLKELLTREIPKTDNHRVTLWGMGGIGKTQCALAYVHENKSLYTRIF